MKKIVIFLLFTIYTLNTGAQVIALNENFNTSCVSYGENYPEYWSGYEIYGNPLIAWTCGPTEGRGVAPTAYSPGIMCTGNDGVTYYVDTAWLITPQLDLSWVSGNIYLQFDSRYLSSNAGRLSLLVSNNYQAGWPPDTVVQGQTWNDVTATATPVINNSGSTEWVTHVIDLTSFKNTPLSVAFLYTSTTTSSDTWVIDNVLTTQIPFTGVPVIEHDALSLSVVGKSTPEEVTLSYSAPAPAAYQLSMYDAVGRMVYKEVINVPQGKTTHTLSGIDLHAGVYLVKMENSGLYSTVKVVIP